MGNPNLARLLHRLGVTQEEVGKLLGISQPTVHRKLLGLRDFTVSEANVLLAFLRDRHREEVTYEQLFGPSAPAEAAS